MRSSRPSRPAARRRSGSVATVLVILLSVLTGAGSPLPAGPAPAWAFPTAGQLATLTARSGYLGVVAERPGGLSDAQVVQAMTRRADLPADQRERLDAVLRAASPAAQQYLAEAFAAGHTVAEVADFATVITGREPRWLSSRLRPIDPGQPGTVEFRGNSISQYDGTTCGSTTVVVARALTDPRYALRLTANGRPGSDAESDAAFRRRLRAEQQRVHDETDVFWPQFAGTPPWGISERLNHDPAGLGARYRWTPTIQRAAGSADRVLRHAVLAADHGYPVPVLIGDVLPRHYVLLLGGHDGGAVFYEPTAGETVVLPAAELARRDFSRLGYPRLAGVILPTAPRVG